jgi:hypothetical protein
MILIDFEARHAALMFVATLAVVLSVGAFAESAKAGASQAGMAAAQSAVRDARDQVQRRQWAQYRRHHWYGQW